jgi:hypothetical protein
VNAPSPVRLRLEIEQEEGTISGRVTVEGADANAFFGWLELISQIERAIDERNLSGGLTCVD